jgi:hypothetical protein
MATFIISLLAELGAYADRPVSEISVVADAAARGAEPFSHLSLVPVVDDVTCLDAVQLHRTALVR